MGLLDLFAKAPDQGTAARLLREGQDKLWQRQLSEAAGLFDKAARCPQTRACALAYRSLLKRMKQDVSGALKDADSAIAAKPDLFEAHFSRLAALLSGPQGRLTEAMESWDRASGCVPQDAEAHFLRLLMLLLFAEMATNGAEDAKGVTVSFRHTPVVRGAIRLLDGYADLASQEFGSATPSSAGAPLAHLGRGLASYRQGRKAAARAAWQLALSACKDKNLMSLKRLLSEVET